MSVALLIAAALIFYAGVYFGAALHDRRARREGYEAGYWQAMCDTADAEALVETLSDPESVHIAIQRLNAIERLQ